MLLVKMYGIGHVLFSKKVHEAPKRSMDQGFKVEYMEDLILLYTPRSVERRSSV